MLQMLPLTKVDLRSYREPKVCHICGERILNRFANDKSCRKFRNHCHFTGRYIGTAHRICNLKFNVPNEIPVMFHNSANYNSHFIIKKLVNELEGQFDCLLENTEKYKTFLFQ